MENILIAVLLTVCMNFGIFQRYAPFKSVVTPRQKQTAFRLYAVLSVVNVAAITTALYIWGLTAAFTYLRFGGILYATTLMVVNSTVIRGRFREHLFVYGVVLSCHYLLMSIPNYVVTFLDGTSIRIHLYVVLGAFALVLLLTFWPLNRLLCDTVGPFLHLDDDAYWNTVCFIPLAFFGTKFINLGGEHNSGSVQQLISSMLYITVIVLMCLSMTNTHKRLHESQAMKKQLESQKLHYMELRVRVEDARKSRHDFKHHIAAIRRYMEMDDKEGLCRYCDDLIGHFGGEESIPYTGNVAADGVLYHYMQQAKQDHIDFHYAGTIHSQGIADVDLCVLLGNALDNALTACLTIPEGRSIRVISKSEKQLLSIVVHNTFDGCVKQSEGGLLSRKRENQAGVGISSMRSVCKRYGGSLDMQWDDHTFNLMIILPLKEEP